MRSCDSSTSSPRLSPPLRMPSPAAPTPSWCPARTPSLARHSRGPWPDGTKTAVFGLGCFWGAEKTFWQLARRRARPRSAMPAAPPRIRPTTRSARARPATPRSVLVVFDPERICYEELLQDVLGGPRPDPGDAPGQRCRHAVPVDHPDRRRRAARASPRRRATPTRRSCRPPATARSRRRSRRAARSTTPRTTTSSTSTRTRAATARTTRRA